MKFFADTASVKEIDDCFSRKVDDGITTNPKIMELTGDLSLGFEVACREIIRKYPSVPISLETDLRGISIEDLNQRKKDVKEVLLKQAYEIAGWGKNVVIKIPVCQGGLEATTELSKKGIKTNVTACMTPYQALTAAKAGATYVSLFANRMLDSKILELAGVNPQAILTDSNWKEIVKQNQHLSEKAWEIVLGQIAYVAKKLDGTNTSLIVGSIRSPKDISRLVKAGPQIITIPYKIVQELEGISNLKKTLRSIFSEEVFVGDSLEHPMTTYSIDEFEKSAELYRKI